MSKEKLEVGDVWTYYDKKETITYIYHVTKVEDNGMVFVLYRWIAKKCKESFEGEVWFDSSAFREMQYLGKAKANINDLFEVAE